MRHLTTATSTDRWNALWAGLRLALGFIFVWAFLDKIFGFGYATKPANAWLAGGSPTKGFLGSTKGWASPFFQAIAGHPATDALFMTGLLLVGVALLLGIGMRVAGVSGATMMLLMYAAATPGVPGTTNPVLDSHIVYALVFLGFALHPEAGDVVGIGRLYHRLPFVQRHPALA